MRTVHIIRLAAAALLAFANAPTHGADVAMPTVRQVADAVANDRALSDEAGALERRMSEASIAIGAIDRVDATPAIVARRDETVQSVLDAAVAFFRHAGSTEATARKYEVFAFRQWPRLRRLCDEPRDAITLAQAVWPLVDKRVQASLQHGLSNKGPAVKAIREALEWASLQMNCPAWRDALLYDEWYRYNTATFSMPDEKALEHNWLIVHRPLDPPAAELPWVHSRAPRVVPLGMSSVSFGYPQVAVAGGKLWILAGAHVLIARELPDGPEHDLSHVMISGTLAPNDDPRLPPQNQRAPSVFSACAELVCLGETSAGTLGIDTATYSVRSFSAPGSLHRDFDELTLMAASRRGVWFGGSTDDKLSLRFLPMTTAGTSESSGSSVSNQCAVSFPLDVHPPAPWTAAPSGARVYGFAHGVPVTCDKAEKWTWLMPDTRDETSARERRRRVGAFLCLLADETHCWAGTTRGLLRLDPTHITLPDTLVPIGPVTALADGGDYIFAAVAPVPYDLALVRAATPCRLICDAVGRHNARHHDLGQACTSSIVAISKRSGKVLNWALHTPGVVATMASADGRLWFLPGAGSRDKLLEVDVSRIAIGTVELDASAFVVSPEVRRIYEDPAYALPSNWPRTFSPEQKKWIPYYFPHGPAEGYLERMERAPLPSVLLSRAAVYGTTDEVAALLPVVAHPTAGADGFDQWNVLQCAVLAHRSDTAMTLIEGGYELNRVAPNTTPPLIAAVDIGDLELVGAMLDRGADGNCRAPDHRSALELAAIMRREDIVRALLDHGANPRSRPGEKTSPLLLALWNGDVAICRLLVEHGASLRGPEFGDESAFVIAAMQDSVELLDALPSLGLAWGTYSPDAKSALEHAAMTGARLSAQHLVARGIWSDDALELAATYGHLRLAHWLERARIERARHPPVMALASAP